MRLLHKKILGVDADGMAETEADHFGNCPVCGAYLDMRDLGKMLAHVHDQQIQIGEGPQPPEVAREIVSRDMKEAATRG